MAAAFSVYIAISILKLHIITSSLFAILIAGGLGIFCYMSFIDRVRENETAVIIISLAITLVLQEVLLLIFTGQFRRIPFFVSGFLVIGGVRVLYQHLFIIAISLVILICLRILLSRTTIGIAIRVVAQDREIANVMGIDGRKICMITMGLASVLAGIAGAAAAPINPLHPLMWQEPLTVMLSAVVLGGLGSIKGSVIAAFLLGFAETAVVFLIPGGSFLKGAVSLSIMVMVLLVRPEGLLGVAFEEERL
jgi:branched-chain amino acid transport system permease protein